MFESNHLVVPAACLQISALRFASDLQKVWVGSAKELSGRGPEKGL